MRIHRKSIISFILAATMICMPCEPALADSKEQVQVKAETAAVSDIEYEETASEKSAAPKLENSMPEETSDDVKGGGDEKGISEEEGSDKSSAEQVLISSVSISRSELSLHAGDSTALSAEVLPENAADRRISWSSSDDSVASVDQNGTVSAVSEGSAVITASSACWAMILPTRMPVSSL